VCKSKCKILFRKIGVQQTSISLSHISFLLTLAVCLQHGSHRLQLKSTAPYNTKDIQNNPKVAIHICYMYTHMYLANINTFEIMPIYRRLRINISMPSNKPILNLILSICFCQMKFIYTIHYTNEVNTKL
jgi:hypothetical protein